MLKDYANEAIDIDRVIRMLLIHDLGEIDAGDTIVYQSETADLKAKEAAGVERVLSYLPAETRDEYIALWHEFESGETADSRYARAIDRAFEYYPALFAAMQGVFPGPVIAVTEFVGADIYAGQPCVY